MPAKVVGLGILGVFEIIAVTETFDFGGLFATKDTWDQADDGINNNQRREFAAGEDVVAERDFVIHDSADALVVALVVGT